MFLFDLDSRLDSLPSANIGPNWFSDTARANAPVSTHGKTTILRHRVCALFPNLPYCDLHRDMVRPAQHPRKKGLRTKVQLIPQYL